MIKFWTVSVWGIFVISAEFTPVQSCSTHGMTVACLVFISCTILFANYGNCVLARTLYVVTGAEIENHCS